MTAERKNGDSNAADRQRAKRTVPSRKAYAPPRLVEYGSIAKLTAGGAGSLADGSMTTKMCL